MYWDLIVSYSTCFLTFHCSQQMHLNDQLYQTVVSQFLALKKHHFPSCIHLSTVQISQCLLAKSFAFQPDTKGFKSTKEATIECSDFQEQNFAYKKENKKNLLELHTHKKNKNKKNNDMFNCFSNAFFKMENFLHIVLRRQGDVNHN